jgi:hypothetical protein
MKADFGGSGNGLLTHVLATVCVPGGGLTHLEAGSNITALCGKEFTSRELFVREESIKKERQPDV